MTKSKKTRGVRQTCNVEEAGKKLGIGRNASYEAVRRGEIPVIRIGKRLLVPIAALDRMLNGIDTQDLGEFADGGRKTAR